MSSTAPSPALSRSQARCVHFMFVTPEAGRLRSAAGAGRATFGFSRAPRLLLTVILRAASSGRYRETLGNSAEECRGLTDLLSTEAGREPALREAAGALLALRPAESNGHRTAPSRRA